MLYISINAHVIRSNTKNGVNEPPIRIARTKSDQHPVYAREIEVVGPASLIYDPDKAIMRCGARMVLICADAKVTK